MLYTHAGANAITRAELNRFHVPTIEQLRDMKSTALKPLSVGNRWAPVPFADMAHTILSVCYDRGLHLKRESYAVSRDGFDLYSCFDFTAPIPGRDDMSATLGWRYSNVQRFALKGVSGARVFVCDNGAIVGDFVFGHKMTNGHERHVSVSDGLDRWERQVGLISRAYKAMESIELNVEQVDHILMDAVRAKIIAPSQLGKIDAEWGSERSKTQFGEQPTLRRLYEAVTETGKSWSSLRVQERGLRGFPDMALKLYGEHDLAAALTEGDLGEPSAN